MILGILAAVSSSVLQPFFPGLSRKANHPLTVNFWGMSLASIIFSFCFLGETFWSRFSDFWVLIFISGILKSLYVSINLPLFKNHEFQVLYPLTRIAPIFILFGEIFF